jgi:hypothetical protein
MNTTNANPFAAVPVLDPRTNLRTDVAAYDALVIAAAERRTRDEQHERTLLTVRKARRLLEERRNARRFLGKVALMQAAAVATLAVFARAGMT